MWSCSHCKLDFEFNTTSEKANHSRWCESNPKRHETTALAEAIARHQNRKLGEIKRFNVTCEKCCTDFVVEEREKQFPRKAAYFCSRSCSAYRGSGLEWGRGKRAISQYKTICFAYHARKCVVCAEDKIVEVHHLDENHENNDPSNLVPMCPTHHQYWHSPHKHDVEAIVLNYINIWKSSQQ